MKNNKLYIVLWVVIGILVLVGASFIGRSIINRQNMAKEVLNNGAVPSDFSLNGNTCHNRSKYFVIVRPDVLGNAGEDILVKYKVSENSAIDCKYKVADGDFELLNTPLESPTLSQYFSSINDNKLIVSEGTGANLYFVIYDLDQRTKVFSDTYSAGLFDLQNGVLSYWHKTKDIPNKLNCARVDEYNLIGGAKIEAKISLNLSSLTDKNIIEFRCSPLE